MKILMVSPGVFPLPAERGGGAESHVWGLTKELAASGHEVHLISDIADGEHLPDEIISHPTHSPHMAFEKGFFGWVGNLSTGGLFASRACIDALIKDPEFDIVHLHQALTPFFLRFVRKFLGHLPPIVCTVHSPPLSYDSYTGVRRLVRKISYVSVLSRGWYICDHLIGSSSEVCEDLVRTWNISQSRVTYVPQGVDSAVFSPNISGIEKVRAKFGIPEKYCIFVGLLSPRKGPDVLLRALAKLGHTGVLVGGGPLRNQLVELARELGVSSRVVFTGSVTLYDLVRLYAGASAFVFPSRSEGAAIAPLEAMASGLPVILSDVPGARDYVIPETNGYLVKREDVDELARVIKALMENESKRLDMGRRARLLVLRKFSWPTVAEATERVYRRVLGNKLC